jgi:hypothetical protein
MAPNEAPVVFPQRYWGDIMNFHRSLLTVIAALALFSSTNADVTVERSDRGAVVEIDGRPFTEYRIKAGQQPALYPVIGPAGRPVTRTYPFAKPDKDGTDDHPHHQSFWLTHGDVNGIDFWATNKANGKRGRGPRIVHREFVDTASGDVGKIVTRNDWLDGDKRICEDERSFTFGSGPGDSRWIDFALTIKATDADVTFGDTKEGAFSVRVADSMRVDAKKGGRISNSEKQINGDAWGQPARWVDYTGPVEGETVGITFMSHPKSFRPTPRWHVRTYGLFAANPFGNKDFSATDQGPVTIKKGDSTTFKYRVWLHKGATNVDQIEEVYREFSRQ